MEAAEAKPPAEPAAGADAIAAAPAEYPEAKADHTEPQSAAQLESDAGAEGAPPEGLNGLPLSKSQAKKRAKHEAKQAKKAERKEREKTYVTRKCFPARLHGLQERNTTPFGHFATRAWQC